MAPADSQLKLALKCRASSQARDCDAVVEIIEKSANYIIAHKIVTFFVLFLG
jgi:hypothetical protein